MEKIYKGQNLNNKTFRKNAEAIIEVFRRQGYSYAFFDKIKFENGTLEFYISEGIVSEIKIKGNKHIDDYLVQRELHIEKGNAINSEKIIKSYENLVSSDLFTNVQMNIKKLPDDTTFQTIIKLREKGNQMLSFGASINNERYLQLGLDLIQYNIFNTGLRFSLRAAGGLRNFNSSATILQQRLLKTHITGGFQGYYNYIKRWVYDRDWSVPSNRFKDTIKNDAIEEGFGFKATLGLQLVKLGNIRTEYRYERQRHYNKGQSKTPLYTLNTIKLISVIDSRNNLYFPNWGRFIELSFETSLFPLKNDASFSKLYFNYQSSHSFGSHTIRPRVMLGFADKTLPQNEFFNLGGESLFFGMRENESRGRQLVLGSLEYQYKAPFDILFDTYFSFRYDLGTTWEVPEEIKFASLRHGAGLSIGLDTPIGPARFSAGESFYFRQDPYMVVWGYLHLYFSIGVRI
jgi:NTE family protein